MSLLLALAAAAATPIPAQVDKVAERAKLAGEILVAKGDTVLLDRAYGTVAPQGGVKHVAGKRWRLASISKQITAAFLMRLVARGQIALDAPLETLVDAPQLAGVTMRMLLQHHSGLVNPDDTPKNAAGVPAFYTKPVPDEDYCLSKPGTPNALFAYNNCDYLIADGFRDAGASAEDKAMWPANIRVAQAGDKLVPGFVHGKPEAPIVVASFGAAGAYSGSARDVLAFDRALMTGKLLPPTALAELWKPEGGRSYQALGQWVFPGQLKGCAKPKRIVQRDGEIGGVQTRNYILPDDDLVVIVFTNRSSEDFAIGEVWQQSGFAYDLLSAVAC